MVRTLSVFSFFSTGQSSLEDSTALCGWVEFAFQRIAEAARSITLLSVTLFRADCSFFPHKRPGSVSNTFCFFGAGLSVSSHSSTHMLTRLLNGVPGVDRFLASKHDAAGRSGGEAKDPSLSGAEEVGLAAAT